MSNKCFGVALFGTGRAGGIHLHNLRTTPRVQLVYIVEQNVEAAKLLVQEYRLSATVVSPEHTLRVLQDPKVDAVVVATPTFTHQGIVKLAVQNGKPVFCEKPIAENGLETQACYEAAEKAGLTLMCSFNRRYDPSIMELKERVLAGEIGKVHLVKITARDHPRPPNAYLASSGGFFHDCAVHDLDGMCWILGEFPTQVHAYAQVHDSDIKAMGDTDTAVVTLQFPSGALGVIDISRHANYGYDQRHEVFGSGGMLLSENQLASGVVNYGSTGILHSKIKHSFPQRYAESYVNALHNFLDIIEGKKPLDVTKNTTLEVSRLASACEESVKTGKNIIMANFSEK